MREKLLACGCCGEENGYNTQLLYFTCSSLSSDDRTLFFLSDRDGNPNIGAKDLVTGKERLLTGNRDGLMQSYVYFAGTPGRGLSKASVSLDPVHGFLCFIWNHHLCRVTSAGEVTVLADIPEGMVTAFTHISADGTQVCVPMTDGRILDYDPRTEGTGLDLRPAYDIDGRVQKEHLSSYLCVYDTETGALVQRREVKDCWITHVQFNPKNPDLVMYNHEWSSFDCGIRRIWIWNRKTDELIRVRTEGKDSLGNPRGHARSRNDWICHEMWSDDGKEILYHGGYENGPALVGKCRPKTGQYWETALPDDYTSYGHFTMDHAGNLVCDGYFRFPGEQLTERENPTDNGPDPHKKDGAYISLVVPDWEKGTLTWIPQCRHDSDWLGQDAHPHPIFCHSGKEIFFNARSGRYVKIYRIPVLR